LRLSARHAIILGMTIWVDQIFSARQAREGGMVRRALYDVNRLGAYEEIVERARAEDWHVVEIGDQLAVLCHPGQIQLVC